MKQRKIKIYEMCGTNPTNLPKILLQGKWLKKLGYYYGDYVEIQATEEEIIIRKTAKTP